MPGSHQNYSDGHPLERLVGYLFVSFAHASTSLGFIVNGPKEYCLYGSESEFLYFPSLLFSKNIMINNV